MHAARLIEIAQVPPEAVPTWIAAHTTGDGIPLLLDVREPDECALVSIAPAGAELAQWSMVTVLKRLDELDPERPTLLLCHSGQRSQWVAEFLAGRSFRAVANLAGGIDAWACRVDPALPRY